jgi:hypothetical protein
MPKVVEIKIFKNFLLIDGMFQIRICTNNYGSGSEGLKIDHYPLPKIETREI